MNGPPCVKCGKPDSAWVHLFGHQFKAPKLAKSRGFWGRRNDDEDQED